MATMSSRQVGGIHFHTALFLLLATLVGLSQSVGNEARAPVAEEGGKSRLPLYGDHRPITERWSPNVFAALQLYSLDAEYNRNCLGHLMAIGGAVKSFKMWAIKMVDAFGKPGSYILRGNTNWQGSYSMCFEVEPDKDAGVEFTPSYCWVTIQLKNLPKITTGGTENQFPPIRTGVCIPDSCSAEELYRIFLKLPDILNLPFYSEHINVTGVTCEVVKPTILLDSWAVMGLSVLFAVFVLALLGTAVEYHMNHAGLLQEESEENASDVGPFWEILLAFSIPRNTSILMNFDASANALPSVHGLRSLFVIWAIAANTYFFSLKVTDNILDFLEASEGPLIQFFLKFSLGMDGLFFLTALGVTLHYFKLIDDKNTQSRMVAEYVIRIVRLWIPYMVILLVFFCSLGNYLGGGPFWNIIEENTNICQRDWWFSAAYINNFVRQTEEQCMRHSWYMANDMQYYLMIPLILIPLARWAPVGFMLAAVFQGVSMLVTGVLTYNKNLPPMIDLKVDRPGVGKYDDYMDSLYVKPYYHIGASLLGMICGWTLHRIQRKASINKVWAFVGWLFCAAFLFFALYGNSFENSEVMYSVFYHLFKDVSFGLTLFWIVVACATGNGGFVNWFLNLPLWNPLGRLSYCAFLVHGGWLLFSFINTEIPRHFSFTLLNCYAVSNVVICYAFGFLLCLFFEAPIVNLKRYFVQSCPVYKRLT